MVKSNHHLHRKRPDKGKKGMKTTATVCLCLGGGRKTLQTRTRMEAVSVRRQAIMAVVEMVFIVVRAMTKITDFHNVANVFYHHFESSG